LDEWVGPENTLRELVVDELGYAFVTDVQKALDVSVVVVDDVVFQLEDVHNRLLSEQAVPGFEDEASGTIFAELAGFSLFQDTECLTRE